MHWLSQSVHIYRLSDRLSMSVLGRMDFPVPDSTVLVQSARRFHEMKRGLQNAETYLT